jgi:chromate transporter
VTNRGSKRRMQANVTYDAYCVATKGSRTRMGTTAGQSDEAVVPATKGSWVEVIWVFFRLGCTSFGGPVAHLGYFRSEFVQRRGWLDDKTYADLVALCQFLPGPASSQVGIAVGLSRAGWRGGLAAWTGFTLPSALALTAFGYGIANFGELSSSGVIHGLKIVAVAVVAQAVWGMANTLCTDLMRKSLAVLATLIVLIAPNAYGQVGAIVAAGIVGWLFIEAPRHQPAAHSGFSVTKPTGALALVIFAVLLVALPLASSMAGNPTLAVIDRFYRAGALVFGGGHVVLPLLQAGVVPPGWVSNSDFLAGYGAAQAVPGPLFAFSAFLGTVMNVRPNGWEGGLLCLGAIFLPAALLIFGALPFWDALRKLKAVQSAMAGMNAAVVGVLLAALYDPVWTSAIRSRADFGLALASFAMLLVLRLPALVVVIFAALGGWLLAAGVFVP